MRLLFVEDDAKIATFVVNGLTQAGFAVDHVWDYSFDPTTNVVEACVSRLRKKLLDQTGQKIIKTVKGIGYVLETPV